MRTIKLNTHWTTGQAEDIYLLLDEIKSAIWQSYGEDIVKMHREIAYEKRLEKEESNTNDDLPF
ncbi:MAG: hypothetical protein JKY81_10180 [Colwellia sp.]|nr:hypothetical protein [Colwellia sp.]